MSDSGCRKGYMRRRDCKKHPFEEGSPGNRTGGHIKTPSKDQVGTPSSSNTTSPTKLIGAKNVIATAVRNTNDVSDQTSRNAAEDLITEIKNLLERQLVDCLNVGSKAKLMTLAGIGEKRSGLILEYRKTNAFEEVRALIYTNCLRKEKWLKLTVNS